MFFKKTIEELESKYKKIKLFVDMDGVIADYIVGEARDYDKKRPLLSTIKQLEDISNKDNIELNILSISRMDVGIKQKNEWLDTYAPFFKKENRIIISRESNNMEKSFRLKCNYVKNIKREEDCIIVIIDDDCDIVHKLKDENEDIILEDSTVNIKEEEEKLGKELDTEYPEAELLDVFRRLLYEAPRKHDCHTAVNIASPGGDAVSRGGSDVNGSSLDEATFLHLLSNTFRILSRTRLRPYKNTIETLETLKSRGANLYLLSNAQGCFTHPELEISGVLPYLDDCFISSERRIKKPDPRFLNDLLTKHGMVGEETVMVGNEFNTDMKIAASCGIDGIFLNSFGYSFMTLQKLNETKAPVITDIRELTGYTSLLTQLRKYR